MESDENAWAVLATSMLGEDSLGFGAYSREYLNRIVKARAMKEVGCEHCRNAATEN